MLPLLHQSGVRDIKTAADAARAMEPLLHSFNNSGLVSKSIFALGIIGLGLLAVPILSASAAYAVAEALHWNASLDFKSILVLWQPLQ